MATARYHEVARDLREAIERGEYGPGETIPYEQDLMATYGLSRWTIRQAIDVLKREGLVTPVRRRGTVVRDRRPLRIPLSRYGRVLRPGGTRGPWETACADQGIEGRAEVVSVEREDAPSDVASALGIEAGAHVVRRRRHMWANQQVAQVQESWMPLTLVADTPLAAESKVTGGVYGALVEIGHRPTTFSETLTARVATSDEVEVMGLSPGTPVLVIERVTRGSDGTALEYLRSAGDGDRVQVVYEDLALEES